MFRVFHRRGSNPNTQIPYPLYESLQENSPHRARTFVEVVGAAAIVLLLVVSGASVYKHLHKRKETPIQAVNTKVEQPPQQNTSLTQAQQPATTPQSSSTNDKAIAPPQ